MTLETFNGRERYAFSSCEWVDPARLRSTTGLINHKKRFRAVGFRVQQVRGRSSLGSQFNKCSTHACRILIYPFYCHAYDECFNGQPSRLEINLCHTKIMQSYSDMLQTYWQAHDPVSGQELNLISRPRRGSEYSDGCRSPRPLKKTKNKTNRRRFLYFSLI